MKKSKKRKCPVCGSTKTNESKNYFSCRNCHYLLDKSKKEPIIKGYK